MRMEKISKATMKDGVMKLPTTIGLDTAVENMSNKKLLEVKEMPQLLFSGTFGRGGLGDVRTMTGLLALRAESSQHQLIDQWQQAVAQVPYTLLAYRSIDRSQLYIVVRVAANDGQPPQDTEAYQQLLQAGQRQAIALYQAMAGCTLSSRDISIDTVCPMSYDPQLIYRPEAQPMPVVASKTPDNQQVEMYDDGSISDGPSMDERKRTRLEFLTCLRKALEETPDEADSEVALTTLANSCRQARLEEEYCVKRTLRHWRFKEDEDLTRKVFRAVYATPYNGKTTSQMNRKEQVARTIRDFFNRRYQLRYNEVKKLVEFRPNDGTYQSWQPLGDRELPTP